MELDHLLGELKEFKRATLDDLKEIKDDIQILKRFRWRFDGQMAVGVVFITIATGALTTAVGVWLSK